MSEKAEGFVDRIEKVYAKYNKYVREEIFTWARKQSDSALLGTYKKVREKFSNQYNKPPDLPVLIDAYKEYQRDLADAFIYERALPDPEFEDRCRTMTEEEKAEGQRFLQRLLEGMQSGMHPSEIYRRWQEDEA